MTWLIFGVLSAIALGLYFVFIKISSSQIHPIVGAFVLQIVAALLGLLAYGVLKFGTTEKIIVSSQGLMWAILAGIAVGAAEILIFFMFKAGGNLSIGTPLVNVIGISLAAMIGILILGESITPLKIAGIILALIGITILST